MKSLLFGLLWQLVAIGEADMAREKREEMKDRNQKNRVEGKAEAVAKRLPAIKLTSP